MEVGAHIIVSGMVQGVGFRYFVYSRAKSLGITGSVRNLHDGSVEILAEGDRSLVEDLIREVKVGPRAAHVSDVHIRWTEPGGSYNEFTIK